MLQQGRIEVFATNKGILFEMADELPGAQVLPGRWGFENLTIAIPKGRAAGKLRVLAVLSPNRSPIYPEVPTIAESGFPGFEASVWYGFIAPTATPRPIIERLHAEVQKALQAKDVRDRLASAGGEVLTGSIEQFAALIRSERQRYEKLVREADIKLD
jgi:tripartite-type tricarboxylate transporter receptor subunit TctC